MPGAARREQLLDATSELVAGRGFGEVTVEAVAGAAGVTRTLVYKHFADLPELLDAMVEREMARALTQVSETALTDLSQGEPVELILESLSAYLTRSAPTRPPGASSTRRPQNAPEVLRKRIARGRAEVLDSNDRGRAPGVRRRSAPPDAELTARILSAISDEYARLVLADCERFPPERLPAHARWLLERARRSASGSSSPPRPLTWRRWASRSAGPSQLLRRRIT